MPPKRTKENASEPDEGGERSESESQRLLRQRFFDSFSDTYDFANVRPDTLTPVGSPNARSLTQADVDKLFENFTEEEPKLSAKPQHKLVRPSGDFDSATGGLSLHWPTNKTTSDISTIRGVADPGNNCLLRLFRKGLSPINTVWLDLYSRRADVLSKAEQKQRKTPIDNWDPALRELHENFTKALILPPTPTIRIWLLFGAHVREWLEEQFKSKSLNTTLQKIKLGSVHAYLELAGNLVERIFITCYHPMYLFFPSFPQKGEHMDAAVNLFAALTTIEVSETYFTDFYCYRTIGPVALASPNILGEVSGNIQRPSSQRLKPRSHHQALNEMGEDLVKRDPQNAADKAQLLTLLYGFMEDSTTQVEFNDLPSSLQEWFQQRNIHTQIEAESWANGTTINTMTYLDTVATVMAEEYDAAIIKDKYTSEWALRMKRLKYKDFFIVPDAAKGRPASVMVFCKKCKSSRMDYNPIYLKGGEYLVRRLVCYGCGRIESTNEAGRNQRRLLWPVSRDLEAVGDLKMRGMYYHEFPDADGAEAFERKQDRERKRRR